MYQGVLVPPSLKEVLVEEKMHSVHKLYVELNPAHRETVGSASLACIMLAQSSTALYCALWQ
jgi:hypothetical protein